MTRWKYAGLFGFLALLMGIQATEAAQFGRMWAWNALLSLLCLLVAFAVVRLK